MKSILFTAGACLLALSLSLNAADDGWTSLFDGKTLKGWKESGGEGSFFVEDGKLVAKGKPMGHLFYVGDVNSGAFKDFELKLEVMTKTNSNSGVYFHTRYQEQGWPQSGFECQVNATHGDWRKSGGLYSVVDVKDVAPHKDNEWWNYHITVKGKTVTIRVNGKQTAEWTQPDDWKGKFPGRAIGSGTFALQAHDPNSVVYFKKIRVKTLP